MEDCSICCDTYNKSNRTKIVCPTCNVSFCRTCVQRYMLDTQSDAHCMSCRTGWNREFVDMSCTRVFRSKLLKQHRENILFNRQMVLLPQTQYAVESYSESIKLAEMVKDIDMQITLLARKRSDAENQRLYHNEIWQGYNTRNVLTKREFVRRCPCDGCKGFLSTAWKCGVCSKNICKDCNEEKVADQEHVCKPENVETVKLLNKDTKGCPKCGTLIFKISGCSQMWCPDCHTAFNWNTLAIETGVIHNPHFFEFQRNNASTSNGGGRNLADIPCGGLPSIEELRMVKILPYGIIDRLHNIIRSMRHIEYVELPSHVVPERNWVEQRVKYMINELTEDKFKIQLQRDEKNRSRGRDIAEVFRMVINIVSDILRQLVLDGDNYQVYLSELERLREYANVALNVIGYRYGVMAVCIYRHDWSVIKV